MTAETLPPLPEHLPFRALADADGPCYTADQMHAHAAAARAQALEDAAQAAGPEDSYQDEWFKAKADSVKRIRSLIDKDTA